MATTASGIPLAQFPAEIMADVTSWLSATDLCHLIWTGNSRLNYVLKSGGVSEFHHVLSGKMPREGIVRWPTLVHSFPRLRSVSIVVEAPQSHCFIPVSDVRPDLLPKTVEEIRFGFLQAESCFQRYPREFDYSFAHQLPLDQRAELGNYTGSEELPEEDQEDFADDNDEIVTFSQAHRRAQDMANAQTPPGPMRLYSQRDYEESVLGSDGFDWSSLFPRLRRLSLSGHSTWTDQDVLNLHSGIERLHLNAAARLTQGALRGRSSPVLAFTHAPKDTQLLGLTEMVILNEPNPFLSSALHIRTIKFTNAISWDDLAHLPASTTSLTMIASPQAEHHKDPSWPASLTSLTLTNSKLPSCWPSTLKELHLTLNTRLKRSTIRALPATLETFRVVVHSPNNDSWSHSRTLLLPQGLRHLLTSPTRDQLVAASNGLRLWTVDMIQSLADRFPRLESLEIPRSDTLPSGALVLLPATLTFLDASIFFETLAPAAPPTKFPAAPPASNVKPTTWPPNLTHLNINSLQNIRPDRSFAESLPRCLQILYISRASFKTCFFEKLPPTLVYLNVGSTFYDRTSPLITAHLPRSLMVIRSPAGTFESIDAVLLLPRTIVSADILYPLPVNGDKSRLVPPSLRLETRYLECTVAYDLPPRK